MLGTAFENKANVMTAVIAWWELLAKDAGDFMFFGVLCIVDDPIDTGSLAFVSRLEYITTAGIAHKLRCSLSSLA
jgi:hypothetical protein